MKYKFHVETKFAEFQFIYCPTTFNFKIAFQFALSDFSLDL